MHAGRKLGGGGGGFAVIPGIGIGRRIVDSHDGSGAQSADIASTLDIGKPGDEHIRAINEFTGSEFSGVALQGNTGSGHPVAGSQFAGWDADRPDAAVGRSGRQVAALAKGAGASARRDVFEYFDRHPVVTGGDAADGKRCGGSDGHDAGATAVAVDTGDVITKNIVFGQGDDLVGKGACFNTNIVVAQAVVCYQAIGWVIVDGEGNSCSATRPGIVAHHQSAYRTIVSNDPDAVDVAGVTTVDDDVAERVIGGRVDSERLWFGQGRQYAIGLNDEGRGAAAEVEGNRTGGAVGVGRVDRPA